MPTIKKIQPEVTEIWVQMDTHMDAHMDTWLHRYIDTQDKLLDSLMVFTSGE